MTKSKFSSLIIADFNGTTKNKRTLNTGKNNILEKGLMVSFEDDTKLGNWSDSRLKWIFSVIRDKVKI